VQFESASNVQFFGNAIHDTGAGGTKYYHSFYATTDSNHVEVGWNHIYNNQSCRGIQFYSTGGSPQYDLIVHDNIVSGQLCDGINFSTIDATKGPIEAYNNLVYHVGLGGSNLGLPNEACFASLGYGAPGGEAIVYGNTFADCGSAGGSTAGGITVLSGSPTLVLTSNLVIQNSSEPIYSYNTNLLLVAASHNVLLTTGTAGVVDVNYQLVAGSPAVGAGTALPGILYDLAGIGRLQSGTIDAGAYLSGAVSTPTGPLVSLSPASLNFAGVPGTKTVTLTNTGNGPLSISELGLTGSPEFSSINNCGVSLAASASCAISVTFTSPTAAITIIDNAAGSPRSVPLQ
jgi:hypothetical protein